MMQLSTPVTLPSTDFSLDTGSRVMLVGSCFAQEVGTRLEGMMGSEHVEVNPFGVQYNPLSIERVLRLLIKTDSADAAVFQGRDALWHSWFHTSHFSSTDEETCRRNINERFLKSKENLRNADLLVITFGTTRCYKLKSSGLIVSNCHKELSSHFDEVEPDLEELTMQWHKILRDLHQFNPKLHVLFTVSPYRYRKYGMHESQIQKAKLLLLIDALTNSSQERAMGCSYFPSYEILLDELRDYRFYATDMLHPSAQAVDIITERFTDWCFTPALKQEAILRQKQNKQNNHKTITPQTAD